MRVALYLRCSTKEQTTITQREDLSKYATQRGFEIVEIFDDQAQSGAKDDRPALNLLMQSVRKRKIDAVIVLKLDRLGRSLRHLVNTVCELEFYGVKFISVNDQLDLSTPYGRFMFQVFSAFSELEREMIKERCARGRLRAVERGVKFGRKKSMPVARIQNLRAQGLSIRQIAKEVKSSPAGVHKVLKLNA